MEAHGDANRERADGQNQPPTGPDQSAEAAVMHRQRQPIKATLRPQPPSSTNNTPSNRWPCSTGDLCWLSRAAVCSITWQLRPQHHWVISHTCSFVYQRQTLNPKWIPCQSAISLASLSSCSSSTKKKHWFPLDELVGGASNYLLSQYLFR